MTTSINAETKTLTRKSSVMRKNTTLVNLLKEDNHDKYLRSSEAEIVASYCYNKIFLNAFSIIYNNYLVKDNILSAHAINFNFNLLEKALEIFLIKNDKDSNFNDSIDQNSKTSDYSILTKTPNCYDFGYERIVKNTNKYNILPKTVKIDSYASSLIKQEKVPIYQSVSKTDKLPEISEEKPTSKAKKSIIEKNHSNKLKFDSSNKNIVKISNEPKSVISTFNALAPNSNTKVNQSSSNNNSRREEIEFIPYPNNSIIIDDDAEIKELRKKKIIEQEQKEIEERKQREKEYKKNLIKKIEEDKKEVDGLKVTFDYKGNAVNLKGVNLKENVLLSIKYDIQEKEVKQNLYKNINEGLIGHSNKDLLYLENKRKLTNQANNNSSNINSSNQVLNNNQNKKPTKIAQSNNIIHQQVAKSQPGTLVKKGDQKIIGLKLGDKYYPMGSNYTNVLPESGVKIIEKGKSKEGEINYFKKYGKYSIEEYKQLQNKKENMQNLQNIIFNMEMNEKVNDNINIINEQKIEPEQLILKQNTTLPHLKSSYLGFNAKESNLEVTNKEEFNQIIKVMNIEKDIEDKKDTGSVSNSKQIFKKINVKPISNRLNYSIEPFNKILKDQTWGKTTKGYTSNDKNENYNKTIIEKPKKINFYKYNGNLIRKSIIDESLSNFYNGSKYDYTGFNFHGFVERDEVYN